LAPKERYIKAQSLDVYYSFHMDHSVRLHIAFSIKTFVTEVTGERFLPRVYAHVSGKMGSGWAHLSTEAAPVL